MTKGNKNKWWLNGGRGSGRTIRLLCEVYENKIAELEQQIEKMKCCENCKFKGCDKSNSYQTCWYCTNKDKWKLGR